MGIVKPYKYTIRTPVRIFIVVTSIDEYNYKKLSAMPLLLKGSRTDVGSLSGT